MPADTPLHASVTLPRSSQVADVPLARTCPRNQWPADDFHAYVVREIGQANAEMNEQNVRNVYISVLMHAIPAGNA